MDFQKPSKEQIDELRLFAKHNREGSISTATSKNMSVEELKKSRKMEERFINLAGKIPDFFISNNLLMMYRAPILNAARESLLLVFEATSHEFWVEASKAADSSRNHIETDSPNTDVYQQQLFSLAQILNRRHIFKETNDEKTKRYTDTRNAATQLRRLLSEDPESHFMGDLSLSVATDIESRFSNALQIAQVNKPELILALSCVHGAIESSTTAMEVIQHIEKKYSTKPEPQYEGQKRPNELHLLTNELIDWFFKCTDKQHKDLCFSAATAVLALKSPNKKLVKHPPK